MTLLDGILLVLLAIGLVRGFSTGLIRQVTSFLGLIVAVFLSIELMGTVGDLLEKSLGVSPRVAPLLGFGLVFLGVQVGAFALARFAETLVGALQLTLLNRVVGGAAGVFQAALMASAMLLPLAYIGLPSPEARETSVLYAPVARLVPQTWDTVATLLPQTDSLHAHFRDLTGLNRLGEPAAAPPRP